MFNKATTSTLQVITRWIASVAALLTEAVRLFPMQGLDESLSIVAIDLRSMW
jgi:hypothetical protein